MVVVGEWKGGIRIEVIGTMIGVRDQDMMMIVIEGGVVIVREGEIGVGAGIGTEAVITEDGMIGEI